MYQEVVRLVQCTVEALSNGERLLLMHVLVPCVVVIGVLIRLIRLDLQCNGEVVFTAICGLDEWMGLGWVGYQRS